MNNLLSQIKYFKQKKKSFKDPLQNFSQISTNQSNQKVKIIFRQNLISSWKYCLAPIIFNSVLYTFLKIKLIEQFFPSKSYKAIIQVKICIETLKESQKQLFIKCSFSQLNNIIQSLTSFTSGTFSCFVQNSYENKKKLCFRFATTKQNKNTYQKVLKSSFFTLCIIIDRLKSFLKVKQEKSVISSLEMYQLRYSLSTVLIWQKLNKKQTKKQVYDHLKQQQNQVNKYCTILTLNHKRFYEDKNLINLSFLQNAQKKNKLQKKYQQEQQKKRNQIKKQKIYSNIDIEKQQNLKGFCIQTKFSVITSCNLVFKVIKTHINRRYEFQKSTQNLQYFNYLLDIAKTQSKTCVRKKPLQPILQLPLQNQNQVNIAQIQIKQKTKRILKTQKNCLDIMKESWVKNICPYYVNYKEENTLYSKLYKFSLEDWKQSNFSSNSLILIDIFLQILNGLYQLSLYSIIHRDLKPDNILIDESCPLKPIVKLIDFGSAIYAHSDSQKYQQNVNQNFDYKLRTTKPYNMDLNQFKKICAIYSPQNLYKYNESNYNRHMKFDIHSVGKIMQDFKQKFIDEEVLNNFNFLIKICTCPDPQFRLGMEQTALFLTTIKNFYFSQ